MATYEELTDDQLLALPTHRLYTIYKLYRKHYLHMCNHSIEEGDEPARMYLTSLRSGCEFIKAELDKRGHIPRKHESKEPKPTKHLSGADRYEEHCTARSKVNTDAYRSYTQPAQPHVGSIKVPSETIGLQVYKKSKKPFKSKNLYNTVKSVTVNPHTNRVAFDFEEDSSIVDVYLCHLRKIKS